MIKGENLTEIIDVDADVGFPDRAKARISSSMQIVSAGIFKYQKHLLSLVLSSASRRRDALHDVTQA